MINPGLKKSAVRKGKTQGFARFNCDLRILLQVNSRDDSSP